MRLYIDDDSVDPGLIRLLRRAQPHWACAQTLTEAR